MIKTIIRETTTTTKKTELFKFLQWLVRTGIDYDVYFVLTENDAFFKLILWLRSLSTKKNVFNAALCVHERFQQYQ